MYNGKYIGLAPGLLLGETHESTSGLYNGLHRESPASGDSYCIEAKELFAKMTTQPLRSEKKAINQLIVDLKNAGIWNKLDLLQVYAQGSQQAANLNWINPLLYTASAINSPTWTAFRGYQGNGSSSYVDTNFSPSSNGVNYQQNNACHYLYCRTNAATSSERDAGIASTSSPICYNEFTLRWTDGFCYSLCNQNSNNNTGRFTNNLTAGFWAMNRTTSLLTEIFKNGNSVNSWSEASNTIPSGNDFVCAVNLTGSAPFGYSTKEMSMRAMSSGLTAAEQKSFYNSFQNYMTQFKTQI